MLLRKVSQKPGETVQVYAERLITLSEEAFPGQQGLAIQRQQIDIFVDGLLEDQLKMKILRENPATLDGAITIATNEQNLRKRFSLRTRQNRVPEDERMEIDHYRPTFRCFKCNKKGHKSKDCRVKQQVNAVDSRAKQSDYYKDIICWYCNNKGHIKRDCRKRQLDLKGDSDRGKSNTQNNQEN